MASEAYAKVKQAVVHGGATGDLAEMSILLQMTRSKHGNNVSIHCKPTFSRSSTGRSSSLTANGGSSFTGETMKICGEMHQNVLRKSERGND